MEKINEATLDFLKQLSRNNNKEWFDKHRPEYLTAKVNFEVFIQSLIQEITEFDPI